MGNVKIFASIIDEATKKQVEDLSICDAYSGCTIRVMPDCHAGMGCTIGSVIKFKDRVVPNTVGVDIGCGMLVVNLGKVDIDLQKLDDVIHEFVPAGFNIHENAVADFSLDFIAPLQDRQYILNSIGTLGGGNHFIEVDIDNENNKYLVIHSGSRNLGVQVCKYWQEVGIRKLGIVTDKEHKKENAEIVARLKAEGRQNEIHRVLQEIKKRNNVTPKALAYIEGEDLEGYLHDMRLCQEYAVLNRNTMADIITQQMGIKDLGRFTTIHNYIDIESCIIRKGAIAAPKDEMVIIPMNMRDGSLICIGKGNEDWLCSAPHGAGRIMPRKQATENLKLEDFRKSMEGIYTTTADIDTIDEAPMAYKSASAIMEDIKDTVKIVDVIKPIYNFKAKG